MRYEIRPMSFGEILDTGFRLVRDHFTVLVGTAAVLYIPSAIVAAYFRDHPDAATSSGIVLAALLVLVLAVVVIQPVVSAAITYAVGEVYLGRTVSIGQCLRSGFSILLPLAGTTIMAAIAISIGILFLVIPGIYLMLSFLLIWQVMVLERRFGFAALGRSRDLMRGNLLRGFGILFIGGLIAGVLGGIFQLVFAFVPLLGPLGSGLAQAAAVAYTSAVAVVLYVDIRCRKEGFEVEHLARLVGGEAAPAATPTAEPVP